MGTEQKSENTKQNEQGRESQETIFNNMAIGQKKIEEQLISIENKLNQFKKEEVNGETIFNIIATFVVGIVLIVFTGELSQWGFTWVGIGKILQWFGICLLFGSFMYVVYIFKIPILSLIQKKKECSERDIVIRIILLLGIGVIMLFLASQLWYQVDFWSGVGTMIFGSGISLLAGTLLFGLYFMKKAGYTWIQKVQNILNHRTILGIILPAGIGIVLIIFEELWDQITNWANDITIVSGIGACLIIWSAGYAIYLKIKSKKENKKNA